MPGDDHGLPIEEWLGFDRSTPQDLLRKARLSLVRIKLAPHGGMNAVSAHENIGFFGQLRTILPVAETSPHTPTALLEICEPRAGAEIFVTNPFAHSTKQQELQCSAMDRNLRPSISRCQPPWLAMDQLTELVAKVQALCADSGLCKGVTQAELGQLAHRCRLQVDPNAKRQGI